MLSYREQVRLFKGFIPVGPKSVADLVAWLRTQVDITEIPMDKLPGSFAESARFNAGHCVLNEELRLQPDDMVFRAFEVERNEKSEAYFSDPHELQNDFIFVIFEEHTVFVWSTCSKLFLELELTRGVSRQEIDEEGLQYRSLLAHLAVYFCQRYHIEAIED